MKKQLFTIIIIVFSIQLFGQYDVWTIDGKVYEIQDLIFNHSYLKIPKANGKIILIDTSEVFAILGKEDTIFYFNGSEQEIKSATMFMKGQIDGLKYKNRLIDVGAFLVGFASPVLLAYTPLSSFYSPLLIGVYVSTDSFIVTNMHKVIRDSVLRNNPDYYRGYIYGCNRKVIGNSTLYAVSGMTLCFITMLLLGQS